MRREKSLKQIRKSPARDYEVMQSEDVFSFYLGDDDVQVARLHLATETGCCFFVPPRNAAQCLVSRTYG